MNAKLASLFCYMCISILTCTPSTATAQPFIEFKIQGGYYFNSPNIFFPINITAILDTSLPPISQGSDLAYYDIATTHPVFAFDNTTPTNLGPSNETKFTPGQFKYENDLLETYYIYTEDYTVRVLGMQGDFTNALNQLPDDPEDYLIDPNINETAIIIVFDHTLGFDFELRWFPGSGFFSQSSSNDSGGFTISIQQIDDPNTPECLADINNDGFIDFFDISAYLQLFSAGCP